MESATRRWSKAASADQPMTAAPAGFTLQDTP